LKEQDSLPWEALIRPQTEVFFLNAGDEGPAPADFFPSSTPDRIALSPFSFSYKAQ
jgi:hypothetical protein